MKQIKIADTTLCREDSAFSFKEKIEIARQLEKLGVDVIELPAIRNNRADTLLIRTVSSFVKNSILSVAIDLTADSLTAAAAALSGAAHARLRLEVPVSPVGMEYTCHKKPAAMLESVAVTVKAAKAVCTDVEFCAVDASRAEPEFLQAVLKAAADAGVGSITICDSAAEMLPDDFAAFIGDVMTQVSVPMGVRCDDKNGMAAAQAILAVRRGVDYVKTAVGGNTVSLETFAGMIKNCGDKYGFAANIRTTELHRTVSQISRITGDVKKAQTAVSVMRTDDAVIHLDDKDDRNAVFAAVAKLGYDLGDEDLEKVFEEFLRVAAKKRVGAKELDAIIANTAMQVPATFVLDNYVINNGNVIAATAQITVTKNGDKKQGIAIGDGPIDAAFLALDQVIGIHYELDDFQIQSVTEGKEAMGSAVVKLRANGKLYSGNGISTDIMGASIRAYINAVNKIVYEGA